MKSLILKLFLILSSTSLFASEFITFGTGEITGSYYPRGKFICNLINSSSTKIRCSVESTDGSIYNINAIRNKEFNFAFSQSDTIYEAISGKNKAESKKIRSVIAVYPELLTFIVNKKSKIKTIEDIREKRINIGNPLSGSEVTTLELLAAYKIKKSDLKQASWLKAEDTADALRDHRIDGYFFMVGHPAQNIKDAAQSLPISILPLKGKEVNDFLKENEYFLKGFIPANVYEGIDKEVETFGVKAVIISHEDVSDTLVYNFVKILLENFDEFKKSHMVYKNITKESLLKGLIAPQHKGAIKYFKEINLL